MATTSKAQFLNDVYTLLKKRYKLKPPPDRFTVFESVLYGICHEGNTRERADQAMARFREGFFDWNEVRVSSIEEIQAVFSDMADAEERANRFRRFLRQLFERTYEFNLEALVKKPQKDAVKVLHEYEAPQADYVLATVVRQALGGHAIPIDRPAHRALTRLGVADAETDDLTVRGTLERAVPKNRGGEFADLIEELAHDTCVEGEPDCPRCELKKICPTGKAQLAAGSTAKSVVKAAAPPTKAPAPDKPAPPSAKPTPAANPTPKAKAEAPKAPAPKVAAAPKAEAPKVPPKAAKAEVPKASAPKAAEAPAAKPVKAPKGKPHPSK